MAQKVLVNYSFVALAPTDTVSMVNKALESLVKLVDARNIVLETYRKLGVGFLFD